MTMFNECLIHLCDCTWLNVLYILNHMLIKHKNIFEYFYLFLGSFFFFFFFKFQKIKKFYNSVFGNSLASQASCKAPVTSLHRRFHDSLASETSNHEKYLEIFSKILGFCHFWDSFSRLLCEWKSSHQVTQRGSWLIGEWKS